LDALEKKSTALELEIVNAQKDHSETIQKMKEFEQKSSQLAQNLKRCIFQLSSI
jgi:myosin-5